MAVKSAQQKLQSFFSKSKPLVYKKGEIILRPDSDPTSLYFLKSGFVRVYRITEWGDARLLVIYKAEDIFPTMWIMGANANHDFFEAMDDVTLYKASKAEFDEYLKKNPDVLFQISNQVIAMTYLFSNRIDNLMFTNAYSRIISRLLNLAHRFGQNEGESVVIAVPLNQKDIAFSIGMTRETANRELSKLERKRLITYKKNFIIIKSVNRLKEELNANHERQKL